jgi:hypothetical protein
MAIAAGLESNQPDAGVRYEAYINPAALAMPVLFTAITSAVPIGAGTELRFLRGTRQS